VFPLGRCVFQYRQVCVSVGRCVFQWGGVCFSRQVCVRLYAQLSDLIFE
jgi:hypothetical protein